MDPGDFGIGQLFWRIQECVVVADTGSGRIVLWNPAAEALFGYSAAEAVGELVEMLIPGHLKARHWAGLARFHATGHGAIIDARAPMELPAVRKTGEEVPIELVLAPIEKIEGSDRRYVLGLIRDLTGRRRAEDERLRRTREEATRVAGEVAEQRLAFLAEASKELASLLDYEVTLASVARLAVPRLADVCIVDLVGEDGTIQRLAVAHVDPSREELVRDLRRRYPPDPNGPHQVAKVLRTGRSQILPEMPDAYLEGIAHDPEHLRLLRILNYRSAIAVPLAARGRMLGVLSLITAESGRRYEPADLILAEDLAGRCALAIDNARLYREAQRAIRVREEFLSIAAHELKTPITSLRGFGQLMIRRLDRGGELDPSAVRQGLAIMDRQTGRLARLVDQLLDISRIEQGTLRLEREQTDLVRLVGDLASAARMRTASHPITVRTPRELWVRVDPVRIEQVLTNLLDNAIKFSPEGGAIDVELAQPRPGVAQLSVRDRGRGIPPEHREQLFERLYRAHGDDHASGLGLGLYISQQIVELHGGQIAVESPPDGGTRFVVTLPTWPEDA